MVLSKKKPTDVVGGLCGYLSVYSLGYPGSNWYCPGVSKRFVARAVWALAGGLFAPWDCGVAVRKSHKALTFHCRKAAHLRGGQQRRRRAVGIEAGCALLENLARVVTAGVVQLGGVGHVWTAVTLPSLR